MGKSYPFSFRRSSSTTRRRRTTEKVGESPLLLSQQSANTPSPSSPANVADVGAATGSVNPMGAAVAKPKKKAGRARLWMRFDSSGESEIFECDKNTIIKRAGIPARDLRILGPVFSNSSNILAREKAMVVNLEYIKAIVTAQEVLLLDPLRQEVLPFVDHLRRHFNTCGTQGGRQLALPDSESNLSPSGRRLPVPETAEGLQSELPFEFQVLEIALEVVCTYFDLSVADLESDVYPVLEELTKNVSTKKLERLRSLKTDLTRLLARVQKARDELEQLLDDDEDMTQLYLTKKWFQNQQSEALLGGIGSNNGHHLRRISSVKSGSMLTNANLNDNDVEDLEMLLEAYFMQLDGTRNKLSSVREYIHDTEDYVNIQMDNQRNELIQLQLIITMASLAVAFATLVSGFFGMNIPCRLYDIEGIFQLTVAGIIAASVLLFLLVYGYARRKKLLGS